MVGLLGSVCKDDRYLKMPEFQLTWDDMRAGMEATCEKYEQQLSEFGIGKLIPPSDWFPRKGGYETLDVLIPRPIRQNMTGGKGIFRSFLVEEKPLRLRDQFAPAALAPENNPKNVDMEDLDAVEYQFWRTLRFQPPLYGADVEGSFFDPNVKGFNPQSIDSILSRTLRAHNIPIPGVTTPYLYFGTWRSIFAWHTEDMDLYSMNYLHFGKPKSWYAISPKYRQRFETMVSTLPETQELFQGCPEFMRHKELMISPDVLKAHNIPYVMGTQYEREFIVTYPGAYHAGFNHGFNCAESTNFATKSWVNVGKDAGFCECRGDTVRIDMRIFGVKMDSPSPEPESPPVIVKRGPGRPRKDGAVPAGIVKRGRGRPRKYPLPVGVGPFSGHRKPLAPVTNGKGRKATVAPRKSISLNATTVAKSNPAAGQGVKRGRGRPRKHPLPDPNQPKRPRGRPRKYPRPDEALRGAQAKRRLGHPPKEQPRTTNMLTLPSAPPVSTTAHDPAPVPVPLSVPMPGSSSASPPFPAPGTSVTPDPATLTSSLDASMVPVSTAPPIFSNPPTSTLSADARTAHMPGPLSTPATAPPPPAAPGSHCASVMAVQPEPIPTTQSETLPAASPDATETIINVSQTKHAREQALGGDTPAATAAVANSDAAVTCRRRSTRVRGRPKKLDD